MKKEKWNNKEIIFLKNNLDKTNKQLGKILNRTYNAIASKCYELKIIKDKHLGAGEKSPSWKGGKQPIKCGECKKIIFRARWDIKRLKNCFCSKVCRAKHISTSMSGNKHYRFKGKRLSSDGYVLIYSPNHLRKDCEKMVKEHRLIMEKHLGRYLEKKEVVHHINGDRSDNRIDNLKLFENSSEHIKHHVYLGKTLSKNGVFSKLIK